MLLQENSIYRPIFFSNLEGYLIRLEMRGGKTNTYTYNKKGKVIEEK